MATVIATLARMEREKMFSVRQVAAALKVTPMTVLRHISAGDLEAASVDGRYVIFETDLNHFRANKRPRGWPKGKARGSRRHPPPAPDARG